MPPITFLIANGLPHFLSRGSVAELVPLGILIVMSVLTWSIVVLRAIQALLLRRRAGVFLRACWQDGSLAQVGQYLARHPACDPWSRMAAAGFAAGAALAGFRGDVPAELGTPDQFLTRMLRRAMGKEALALESGLTALATVASTAPFVGLFGTVWGIYHALLAIGAGGRTSLEQVAGPVGETLIMTGFGLATALPAVLAYNGLARAKRRVLAVLDDFAHDLFLRLASGGTIGPAARPIRCSQPPAAALAEARSA
ncbi:MotA/TolQ/ExbB proton channel family protein [Rhodopila globiformis]|uniref:Biopolymer transport protein ExbB n=1 Tax=Rhodopila globiformis TaxID=1071 RepID=A0A2S6NMY6_RHOGL|nr:MotA/TolQ/ExbB proton channel family protein [Rhodopila globiformis]PPQ37761.1 hypothetical protein CCS01_03055 [Rhodopila globiformis]